jgi:hypothetical protein
MPARAHCRTTMPECTSWTRSQLSASDTDWVYNNVVLPVDYSHHRYLHITSSLLDLSDSSTTAFEMQYIKFSTIFAFSAIAWSAAVPETAIDIPNTYAGCNAAGAFSVVCCPSIVSPLCQESLIGSQCPKNSNGYCCKLRTSVSLMIILLF